MNRYIPVSRGCIVLPHLVGDVFILLSFHGITPAVDEAPEIYSTTVHGDQYVKKKLSNLLFENTRFNYFTPALNPQTTN